MNFKEIKRCKEQKTALSHEVFRYCESQMAEMAQRVGGHQSLIDTMLINPSQDALKVSQASIGQNSHASNPLKQVKQAAPKAAPRVSKNNYLNYDEQLKSFYEADKQILQNIDKQTVRVSFDQNR
jgi:galactokinase/mevalonate kinase-like predicted kinase